MRGKADVDGEHPQLLQHFEDAALRRDRQGKDDEIDARLARELEQIIYGAKLFPPFLPRAAILAAIVDHTEHAHIAVTLGGERPDQCVPALIRADNHGAAVEPALARPVAHQQEHGASEPKQDQKAENVKAPEPEPGIVIARLGEKCRRDRDQENHRPGGSQPEILLLITAERLH